MMRRRLILFIFLLCWPAALAAQVEIHFFSKDFGSSFPHAFVRLTGTIDSTGQAIDANYGFTAVRVSPAILGGAVPGKIQTVDPKYVSRSQLHFSLSLTEDQYRSVLAVVDKWRAAPQPSYQLNRSNCVHFVAEIAHALGLNAPADRKLMKKPRSYLEKVTRDNRPLIAGWNGLPGAALQRAADGRRQN